MQCSSANMSIPSRRESCAHMSRSIESLSDVLVLLRLKNTVYLSSVSSNETSSGVSS
jgi:hypothetical protein